MESSDSVRPLDDPSSDLDCGVEGCEGSLRPLLCTDQRGKSVTTGWTFVRRAHARTTRVTVVLQRVSRKSIAKINVLPRSRNAFVTLLFGSFRGIQ